MNKCRKVSHCMAIRSWALVASVVAHAGHAQVISSAPGHPTQTGENVNALDEIVVTAEKRSERLTDVPMSITAATGTQLADLGITDIAQLDKIATGLTYQQSNFGVPIYGIRGISFFDISSVASPAVSVYVDQMPLPFAVVSRGALLDVDRVEVLKGPQGTLFGENATAGAINFIAAKPTDTFKAGGDVTYGRFDQVEVGGFLSGPVTDTVAVRFAGRTEQRGDWQYNSARPDYAGQRDFNEARILLDWKPASSLKFELNINAWNDKSDTQAAQFEGFEPTIPNGYPPAIAALQNYPISPNNARAADWDSGYNLARNDRFEQVALHADWEFAPGITATSLPPTSTTPDSRPSIRRLQL